MAEVAVFAHSTVDFAHLGKQHGHILAGPDAQAPAAQLPIAIVSGGSGPSALVVASGPSGTRLGEVAILRLMRELEASDMAGSLVLIPAIHVPSPGDSALDEAIYQFLTDVLLPLVDITIEIHSGRGSLRYCSSAQVHLVDDQPRRRQAIAGTLAWNTDYALLDCDSPFTLEAERQGKLALAAEMSGDPSSADAHAQVQAGLANVLAHFGLVRGCTVTRAEQGLPPTRWLDASQKENFRFAPESGIYEPLVPLGSQVAAGQAIGMIHFPAEPHREAQAVVAGADGVLVATQAGSHVAHGDCVACIAQDADPRLLE